MTKVLISSLALCCLAIYLFVSAPERLPERDAKQQGQLLPSTDLFQIVNAMNSHARRIYTKEIVIKGKAVGLHFGEDWAESGVEKGPLPALFLREFSTELEKRPVPLGLYLGSDKPINPSNLFTGATMDNFKTVVETRKPVFSELEGYGSIGMFPDFASAKGCVSCHNAHPDTPKTNWKLNDVMGATTWTWPAETISHAEISDALSQAVSALKSAYETYLEKAASFANPPEIADDWPANGRYVLPSSDVYIQKVIDAAGPEIFVDLFVTK